MSQTYRCLLLLILLTPSALQADNTGGVFGPVIKPGHESLEYRTAYDPDSHNVAQRFHYQKSINTSIMWRGIVQTNKNRGSTGDFDYLQAELFWDLSDDNNSWQQGVRFDLRYRDDDRPSQFGVNWMHQFALGGAWQARLLALSTVQFGDNSSSGVFLGTRASLAHKSSGGLIMGAELYSSYGSSSNLLSGQAQNHQLGPFLVANLAKDWQLFAGALFGLTDEGSPDQNYRLRLTRRFN